MGHIEPRPVEKVAGYARHLGADQRLLFGVTFTGFQAWPGLVVGGNGRLSGTVE
jgi:hypothetical protein